MKFLANFHAFSQQIGSNLVIEVMFIILHTATISLSEDIDNVFFCRWVFYATVKLYVILTYGDDISDDIDNVGFFYRCFSDILCYFCYPFYLLASHIVYFWKLKQIEWKIL